MKYTLALFLGAASSIKLSGEDDDIWTPKMKDDGYIKMDYPGLLTHK